MDHFFSNSDDEENNINEKISLDELYDKKREIEINRLNIYKKILSRVHTKIRMTSKQKDNNQYLFYLVPEFVFGVPKYNVSECISYIIDKLIDNGFHIKYTHPNMLFISWMHYIPAYKREEIKLKTGRTVDGFGNIIDKNKNKNNSINLDNLVLKKVDNLKLENKQDKEYRDISTYKPSGIYNDDILNKIKEKINR